MMLTQPRNWLNFQLKPSPSLTRAAAQREPLASLDKQWDTLGNLNRAPGLSKKGRNL
jgi:hypothetical protein